MAGIASGLSESDFWLEKGADADQPPNLFRAGMAEFTGVLVFVYSGCAAVLGNPDLFAVACAFGLAIAVMGFSMGELSGGHLNPAVSFAMFITGYISFVRMLVYWVAQFLGGIVAAAFLKFGTPASFGHLGVGHNQIGQDVHPTQAFVIEIITSFALVFIVFAVLVDPFPKDRYKIGPLPVGFTVILGILATGNITGGSMNPARSLGPALLSSYSHSLWIYMCGPFMGGALAGLVHRYGSLPRHPEAVPVKQEV